MHNKNSSKTFKCLIGVDEVGRGPLAGPVAVCASLVPYDMTRKDSQKLRKFFSNKQLPKLRDSKRLTKIGRELWFDVLKKSAKSGQVHFSLAYSSAGEIDKRGIAVCIRLLIKKNLRKLQRKIKFDYDDVLVLLDGGLKAPDEYLHQEIIIGGDDKEPIISFASIYAKVNRDLVMNKQGKKFPHYFFHEHKGYGTKKHIDAIIKKGVCDIHRRTFLKNISAKINAL